MRSLVPPQLDLVITGSPLASHLIAPQTGHYLLANSQHAKHYGFNQPEALINCSIEACFIRRREKIETLKGSLPLESEYRRSIYYANQQVYGERKPIQLTVNSLSFEGFVSVRLLNKLPLMNEHNGVYAILTYEEEITPQFSLMDLYQLYQSHYLKPAYAKETFLRYLKIAQHFRSLPAKRELMTLLVLCEQDTAKYAAAKLGIHPRTVDTYKSHLRDRLKAIHLEAILILLRRHHQAKHSL